MRLKTNALVFEVEATYVVRSTGQAFVLARQLAPAQWELGHSPRLGDADIHPVAEIPRVADSAGNQRQDLFAFCLKDAAGLGSFADGQVVELRP